MGLLLVQMYFWLTSLKRFKKLLRYSSPSPAFPQIWPPLPIRKLGAVMKTKRKKKQLLPSTAHTSGAHPPNRALFAPQDHSCSSHNTGRSHVRLLLVHTSPYTQIFRVRTWSLAILCFNKFSSLFLLISMDSKESCHANESLLSRSTSTAEYFR